ncbi:hypothetical protein ACEPAG_6320 [Sanghuangporus baumii]
MDIESHNVTTISILDVSLSLVHIPRSRVPELTRPILKQLLRKGPKFLNLTANEIELSIFAEDDELIDFEPVARRDRQKQRLRDTASGMPALRRRRRSHSYEALDAVEISLEKWRVLQIDSHDDSLSNSGSRVRELSSPLAAAGISILYQSSYLSDFIFVKAARLPEVVKILGAEGFTLYNANPYEPYNTPGAAGEGLLAHFSDETNAYGVNHSGTPGTMSPAVFSRTRSPSMASLSAFTNAISKSGTAEELTSTLLMHRTKMSSSPISSRTTSRASRTPKKSLSPTAAPVEVLAPDLACVGLTESAADVWSVKIITLVGYPELIPTPITEPIPSSSRISHGEHRRNSLVESLYGCPPSIPHRNTSSPVAGPLSPSAVFSHDREDSDAEKDSDSVVASSTRPKSSSSSYSSSDGDEYFSSSSPYNRTRPSTDAAPSPVSATSQSSSQSLPERLDEFRKPGRQPRLSKISTVHHVQPDAFPSEDDHLPRSRTHSSSRLAETQAQRVPFFSFTRTSEGSSLTTDIRILSALFAPDERHMVICSGTLLDAGDELNARAAVEEQFGAVNDRRSMFDLDCEEFDEETVSGPMKCLQIDLQKFGLDKHGLVNRFSRVLEDNNINHMYSSTYKTANLLVDKRNAGRAQALLRSC